jgi:hypothetical protein
MYSPFPRLPAGALRVCRSTFPAVLLAGGAVVAAQNADDPSVLPPAEPAVVAPLPQKAEPPVAPASKPAGGLEIVVLRAGPAPYPWAVPGRIAKSFITNTPGTLEVVAQARVRGAADLADRIAWDITPPEGFEVAEGASTTGPKLVTRLTRPGGNPSGGGEPLALTVTARVEREGLPLERAATLRQDLRDRLRQEYVDLGRSYVPARRELLDQEQFARLYGKKYPGVAFAELNWSKVPGTDERYPVILATERLVATLHQAEKHYGKPLIVSSGFRNPVRQTEVHSVVAESHHQYGRAADLYVAPDSAPPATGRDIAIERDWLKLAAASMRGGGVWVEPMTSCNVNTAGCHVHVDVRDSGARSSVVRVAGRVMDRVGAPVEGAVVRLAGMPARTNGEGRFTIKHVLVPREYELEVRAPDGTLRKQPVEVRAEETAVAVALDTVRPTTVNYMRPRAVAPLLQAPPDPFAASQLPPARKAGVIEPQAPAPDATAGAGGLALGAAAAAAAAIARKKLKGAPTPETPARTAEPSVLPAGDAVPESPETNAQL